MPANLMSKYEYVPDIRIRKWLDKHVFHYLNGGTGREFRKVILKYAMKELMELFPDVSNPYEYAAFTLQYHLVDIMGYSYAHVDYLYPDGETLVLTLKP